MDMLIALMGEYLPPSEKTPQAVAVSLLIGNKVHGGDPIAFVHPTEDKEGVAVEWRKDVPPSARMILLEGVLTVTEQVLTQLNASLSAVTLAQMATSFAVAKAGPPVCLN